MKNPQVENSQRRNVWVVIEILVFIALISSEDPVTELHKCLGSSYL